MEWVVVAETDDKVWIGREQLERQVIRSAAKCVAVVVKSGRAWKNNGRRGACA
jgi:hypothetical protein